MIPDTLFPLALPSGRTWSAASTRKQVRDWAHLLGYLAAQQKNATLETTPPTRTLTGAFRCHGMAKHWLKLAARSAQRGYRSFFSRPRTEWRADRG